MRDIHFKVDDDLFEEWMRIGKAWHGIRSHLMRQKVREVITELKKSPVLKILHQEKDKPRG